MSEKRQPRTKEKCLTIRYNKQIFAVFKGCLLFVLLYI